MAYALDNVLVQLFESEVKQAFQEMGKLRGSVKLKNAGNAQKVQFPVLNKGLAEERTSVLTPIPLMNVSYTPVVATVKNYTASHMTDIFKNNQVNFDDRQEVVMAIKGALERQLDQIIVDELVAASLAKSVPTNISGSVADLTLDALRDAARQLDLDGVPEEGRSLLIHVSGLHNLLDDSKVTSSDFNSIQALIKGDLNSFYGFNIIKMGNRSEGGLPIDGSDVRKNYAFHRDAVGLAMNMDIKTSIDWEPSFGAWRVTGFLSAGAAVIDETGAVEVLTDET